MANTQATQAFYSITLEPGSAPTAACMCSVLPAQSKEQQIFEARGERVFLRRLVIDGEDVKVETMVEHDTFSIVRGVGSFRIPGMKEDLLTISSDSGRMSMLRYLHEKNKFERIHLETFGKSGVRRTVPGQYLAVDPRGRCLMMASVEKNKVVYIFQRNSDGEINISSPHEANQMSALCVDVCPLDTGWEHPVFGALEIDYSAVESDPSTAERPEKHLVYYTVDLGLNHVVRSWSADVDPTANKLFTVPGGAEGPSGVIVCAEGRLYYKHNNHPTMSIAIPTRGGSLEQARKRIIVSGCMFSNKSKRTFFFLLQTDDGDVFKLSMQVEIEQELQQVQSMTLKYYETLPVAREMLLIKKGYIYIVAESGPSKMYHVDSLADDEDEEPENTFTSSSLAEHDEPLEAVTFHPRPEMQFLTHTVDVPALHPLIRTKVDNLTNEDTPQIYAIQGRGDKSVFKTIRHGMSVSDAVESSLGNVPYEQIWTMKRQEGDQFHYYILLSSSYTDKTTVLGIGEEVESLDDTAFLTVRATICAAQMGDNAHVQVHARGVRTIQASGAIVEWPAPTHRTIVAGSANQRQLLLGLSSGELAFFFMDQSGALNALEEYPEMSDKVTAIGIGPTPKGQMQARYGVVGCEDRTIRVLSTDLETPLEARSVQALSDVPVSIEVVTMLDPDTNSSVDFVHIGLKSGLYLRAIIDEATGELSDVRTKFLGHKPVRIFPVEVHGQPCIMACSSRPWLGYHHPVTKQYTLTPLVTSPLIAVRPFISEHLNGLCGIAESDLRIFSEPELGGRFVSEDIALQYTPRNFARNPWYPIFYTIEGDANTMSQATMKTIQEQANGAARPPVGPPRAASHWASCIQALDPISSKSIASTIHLTDNETALCCACVPFESRDWEVYLVVGTAQDLNNSPIKTTSSQATPAYQSRGGGFLHVYKLLDEGKTLQFVHKTRFANPISALTPFKGRVAVGVANELFIYDIGSTAVLRKSRGTVVPNTITSLEASGDRLAVADVAESVTFVVYKAKANRMIPFADDVIQRWTTAATLVDYETVAGGDKFGNLWLLRCPEQASAEADEDGMNGFIVNERSYMGGAPYKLDLRAHIFVNDIPTSVQRTPLVAGGADVLFWSGLGGTMGILVPFISREDVAFFTSLEQALRSEEAVLTGRDHLMFRGYYVPVKGIVDGDLCERFLGMGVEGKQRVAAEVEREVKEVEKKVLEMRGRVAF
ncbi:hypothetical protein B0A48_09925 [Cryoendolithus antarcticus]|uniref:Pre-mRNA-splicing factor rse1 n=1 Tax=Cryoendolithus antarcticus TaxID=1507870 RepID=A0A1V8T3B6_9PEZI|nr:hypothetical protein B0A48_09925 [Cryoendolithus antarcticus]